MIIGYTAGVFDYFHVGHLRLLKNAKGLCDKLVVGVTTDELAHERGKNPYFSYSERAEIVRGIKFVDAVVPQKDMDKLKMCEKLCAKIMFVGDDWYDTPQWNAYQKEFNNAGIEIVYFPYTLGVSSTEIKRNLGEY